MCPAETSIGIQKKTKAGLEKIKVHPRETFDDIINRLLEIHELHKQVSIEENHIFQDLKKKEKKTKKKDLVLFLFIGVSIYNCIIILVKYLPLDTCIV